MINHETINYELNTPTVSKEKLVSDGYKSIFLVSNISIYLRILKSISCLLYLSFYFYN